LSRLRLYDNLSPKHDEFLSTAASLQLRQSKLDGGGTVSSKNFLSQISMIGDNFNTEILENMFSKIEILARNWMTPDQWAIDLVESTPWHETDFDLFGRPWSPTLAPDGYLSASEMAKVPVITFFIAAIASKMPSVAKLAAGGTAAAFRYKNSMKRMEYFEELDEKVDQIVENTSDNNHSSRAKMQRDITHAEELLTLTSAGIATNHHSYRSRLIETLKEKGSI